MKKWRFGIIGTGGIAGFHREAIRELDNCRIVAVAGRSEERTKAFAETCGCEWTTDYRRLLERSDADIVSVTTGSGSHAKIGEDVLEAGKHLVLEKPIAMTTEEAERLVRLANAKGLQLSVISQRRFEPHMAALKKLIDEGRLGKLLLIEAGTPYYRDQAYYDSADWRGTIAEDGGALMNQGIHQIDLLLWLGGPVRSVFGRTATQTHRMEAEDIGAAIVSFESGALGTIISTTSAKPGFPPYIHVYGEKGTVKIHAQTVVHWSVEGVGPPDGPEGETSDGSSNPLAISYRYHKRQIAEIVRSLTEGRQPPVTGTDGKNAVRLVQAIVAASSSGKEIVLSSSLKGESS